MEAAVLFAPFDLKTGVSNFSQPESQACRKDPLIEHLSVGRCHSRQFRYLLRFC